jgi:uncharacterized protein (UPF0261 family)
LAEQKAALVASAAAPQHANIAAPGQPFHDPAADDALFSAIRKWLSPAIPLVELDGAINDPAFAEACVERLMAC